MDGEGLPKWIHTTAPHCNALILVFFRDGCDDEWVVKDGEMDRYDRTTLECTHDESHFRSM